MLNGKMEVWSEKGLIELSGYYKDNKRHGRWIVYKEDGSIKYELDYTDGLTKDRQMEIDASELIEKLEKNSGKILDPEKTEEIIR